MSIEIKELIIRSVVTPASGGSQDKGKPVNDLALKRGIKKMMETIKDKNER
ncbi:MAG: DUF5908 family protein [Bacteroidota bacterium]